MSEQNLLELSVLVAHQLRPQRQALDLLKSMLEHRGPSPPFSETTDIRMVSAETGRVVFEGMPSAWFYNPMGVIHGGWIATLLDSCMGCVVHSTLKAAQTYTTIEMKTVFVRAAHAKTALLRCEGTLLHGGKRIASSEGKVFDSEGRLITCRKTACDSLRNRPKAMRADPRHMRHRMTHNRFARRVVPGTVPEM